MQLNSENIEMYIMMLVDEELSDAEATEVLEFLKQHPEYEATYIAFQEVKIDRTPLVYGDVSALLKDEAIGVKPRNTRAFINWKMWGSVAAVFIAGIIGFTFWQQSEDAPSVIVKQVGPAIVIPDTIVQIVAKDTLIAEPVTQKATYAQTVVKRKEQQQNDSPSIAKDKEKQSVIPHEVVVPNPDKLTREAPIIVQQEEPLNVPKDEIIEELPEVIPPKENRNHRFAKVNTQIENYPIIEGVNNALGDKVDLAKNIAKEVKNTKFQLRIGSKTINLN